MTIRWACMPNAPDPGPGAPKPPPPHLPKNYVQALVLLTLILVAYLVRYFPQKCLLEMFITDCRSFSCQRFSKKCLSVTLGASPVIDFSQKSRLSLRFSIPPSPPPHTHTRTFILNQKTSFLLSVSISLFKSVIITLAT